MSFLVIREGMDCYAVEMSAKELSAAKFSPLIAGMSAATGYSLGESDQYLSCLFTSDVVCRMEYGSALAVFCPTGAGKTIASERAALDAAKERSVIFLTNRTACKHQLLREFGKQYRISDIPEGTLNFVKFTDNLDVMTYQQFVQRRYKYQGKDLILFLDECHCLAEDATFSEYSQKMLSYLRNNLDNTIRIYMTATPDAVLPLIWELEALTEYAHALKPLTPDNWEKCLCGPLQKDTRIQHMYLMKPNWDYLTFRLYRPDKRNELIDCLKVYQDAGKKILIYLNDIQAGAAFQERLGDSQHIYSAEDKQAEIHQIVINEQFPSDILITTKVAENGLSLHDADLAVIVAETYDLTALQQIIGRARVNRKNPREIIVLIPDYTVSELGSIYGTLCTQLREFSYACNEPDMALANKPQTCVYYDPILKHPVANELGKTELQRQCDYIQMLRAEENECRHAFARSVLALYGKPTEHIEEMYIGYDTLAVCHERIRAAWDTFKDSKQRDPELKVLKDALKAACNETGAYPKELKSNIQIETVNEILRFAGISETLLSGCRVYDILNSEMS